MVDSLSSSTVSTFFIFADMDFFLSVEFFCVHSRVHANNHAETPRPKLYKKFLLEVSFGERLLLFSSLSLLSIILFFYYIFNITYILFYVNIHKLLEEKKIYLYSSESFSLLNLLFMLSDLQPQLSKALEHLKSEYSKLQAGRAKPELVEDILVPVYGSAMPVKNVATVSVMDQRTLTITPFDRTTGADICRGIAGANV